MASPIEKASIQYLKWDPLFNKEKPFHVFMDIPLDAKDQRVTNITFEDHDVEFHDIRGCEETFSLDTNGFMVRKHQPDAMHFASREAVESQYLPEIEHFLKREVDEVDRVCFFDWRLRHGVGSTKDGTINLQDRSDHLRPANYAHIDTAPISALHKVRETVPHDYDRLIKGRVRVINVWRPLVRLVEDWPLAVCDGRTVKQSSLVEADVVRRNYISSNIFLMYDQGQKWHYLHKQQSDEVLIFKQFDTRLDVSARHCPHGAFQQRIIREDALPRESIEVRALVFTLPRADEKDTDSA